AKKGRDALKVEWDEAQAYRGSSDAIVADYRERAKTPGLNARNDGNAEAALAKAGKVIEAEYVFPYLAHASMEPLNCVMKLENGECEV
ncbi:molybdopterin-dependent oxidoreductase, partial [Salmonella enterica subsp. enterica serovar Typhimurium]|nr:molybdopterin-dependent oxidoreductase [Salmonella enterica subsp. enterica serovar Typhimurium]